MILNLENLDFSNKKNNHRGSLSTKLTTAIWSPDHTSRQPSPTELKISAFPVSPNFFSLQINQERLKNIQKYFHGLQQQLKHNLDISINKIEIKKNEIISKIEFKFQEFINEAKSREKKKSKVVAEELKSLSQIIKKNEEIIERIDRGLEYSKCEFEGVINFEFKIKKFEDKWLEIPVDDFNFDEFSDKIRLRNEKLENFSRTSPKNVRITDKKPLISTLHIENYENKVKKGRDNIKLYLPYGSPPYSCYYVLDIPQKYSIAYLIHELKKEITNQGELMILIKESEGEEMKEFEFYDQVPRFSVDGWPKLYLKFLRP